MAQTNDPTQIFNHDIAFLYDMINRFIVEAMHSQSNGVSGMIIHDQDRMEAYITALRTKKDWIMDFPILDLPETHPRAFELEDCPTVDSVESETVNQFIRLLEALRTEMINSQSARLASTLQPADANRFDMIVNKIETFLNDYVKVAVPLDLPESSPNEPLQPAGQRGV